MAVKQKTEATPPIHERFPPVMNLHRKSPATPVGHLYCGLIKNHSYHVSHCQVKKKEVHGCLHGNVEDNHHGDQSISK